MPQSSIGGLVYSRSSTNDFQQNFREDVIKTLEEFVN